MKRTTCACWNCNHVFAPNKMPNVCPHCGASLTPFDYDEHAKGLLQSMKYAQQTADNCKAECENANNAADSFSKRHPFLYRIFKKHFKKKCLAAKQAGQEADAELARARKAVNVCAFSSYCTSEWFKRTGILPAKQGGANDSPFLRAVYLPDGQFEIFIKHHDVVASGLYGEYRAFDMLSRAIDMGEFGRAHLLYDVLIPKVHESRRSNRPRYAQVDFLLITQRAVYVIEAKNLNGNIECLYRKKQREYQVFVSRCTSNGSPIATPRIEDHGPSQNKEHKRCLLERCISISPDETVSVVAYAKKHQFYAPNIHAQRMSHVATLDKGALGIVRLIKAIEETRPVLRSPSETDDLAKHIGNLFADADGEATRAHAMGIARIEQINALYK